MEIWKNVKDYEGLYEVSNLGRVKSLKFDNERILKGGSFSNGYKFVCLRKNGRSRNELIHRLVAKSFIPNPNRFTDVNHKDGNKTNNRLDNLEWCSRSENLKHAIKIGLVENQCKIRRKCKTVNLLTNETKNFDSMKDCCDYFGHDKNWIRRNINKESNVMIYDNYIIYVSRRGCL